MSLSLFLLTSVNICEPLVGKQQSAICIYMQVGIVARDTLPIYVQVHMVLESKPHCKAKNAK